MKSRDYEELTLRPRWRWFAHPCRDAEDGWFGPHRTIEAAVIDAVSSDDGDGGRACFVAQGRKLAKWEIEEMGVEYDWEVVSANSFVVRLPAKWEDKACQRAK